MFKEILVSALYLCTVMYAGNETPEVDSESLSLQGGGSYYDLGVFGSSLWDYIQWDNDKGYSVIKSDMMDDFFKSICGELKAVNINQVYLSFAQLSALDCYYDNDASAHKLEVKTPRSGGPFYLNFMGYESPCISWVDCYQATFRSAPRASANIRRDAVASLTRSRITVPKLGILSKTRNRSIKYS